MKFAFPAAAALALASVVGCQSSDSKKMSADPSVTQLSPAPMSSAPAAPMAPAPMAAMADAGTPTSVTPAYAASPAATTATDAPVDSAMVGSKYTVKKGDTLWKIAASKYGDGKQYKKICQANPGLTPAGLKVGQTITLP